MTIISELPSHFNELVDAVFAPNITGHQINELIKKNREQGRPNYEIVSTWDVSAIKDFSYMFAGCYHFNGDVSGWDVSNAESFRSMFDDCHLFNCDLSAWNTAKCEDMTYMFKNCYHFNGDISGWDVSSCHDFDKMLYYCRNFDRDLSNWTPAYEEPTEEEAESDDDYEWEYVSKTDMTTGIPRTVSLPYKMTCGGFIGIGLF